MDKELLKVIADNPPLMEAVKKVIMVKFSLETLGTNYPNEILGQLTRSRLEGRELVELAFKDIANYKTVEIKPQGANPAR